MGDAAIHRLEAECDDANATAPAAQLRPARGEPRSPPPPRRARRLPTRRTGGARRQPGAGPEPAGHSLPEPALRPAVHPRPPRERRVGGAALAARRRAGSVGQREIRDTRRTEVRRYRAGTTSIGHFRRRGGRGYHGRPTPSRPSIRLETRMARAPPAVPARPCPCPRPRLRCCPPRRRAPRPASSSRRVFAGGGNRPAPRTKTTTSSSSTAARPRSRSRRLDPSVRECVRHELAGDAAHGLDRSRARVRRAGSPRRQQSARRCRRPTRPTPRPSPTRPQAGARRRHSRAPVARPRALRVRQGLIADLVGYGSASDYEGATAAPALERDHRRSPCGNELRRRRRQRLGLRERRSCSARFVLAGDVVLYSGGGGLGLVRGGGRRSRARDDLPSSVSVLLDHASLAFGTAAVGSTPTPLAESVTVTSTDTAGYVLTAHRTSLGPGRPAARLSTRAPPSGGSLGTGMSGQHAARRVADRPRIRPGRCRLRSEPG